MLLIIRVLHFLERYACNQLLVCKRVDELVLWVILLNRLDLFDQKLAIVQQLKHPPHNDLVDFDIPWPE